MNYLSDPAFQLAISLSYSMLFGLAAMHKFREMTVFRTVLGNYKLLPTSFLPLFSWLIPIIELLIIVGLVVEATRMAAAFCASFLLLIYGASMAVTILRKQTDLDCGCHFGSEKQTVSWLLVVRNLLLGAIPLLLLLPTSVRDIQWLDWVVVVFVLVTFSLIYLTVNTLIEQQRKLRGLFS